MLELVRLDVSKKPRVSRVRTRPSAFEVVDAEVIQLERNPDLVFDRQRKILGLSAVSKGRIVDLHFLHRPAPEPLSSTITVSSLPR